jgi:deoxycytidylate deaminase
VRIVTDEVEIQKIGGYMEEAAMEAEKSNCKKSKRGAVVVNADGEIIGRGYNEALVEKYCDPCVREDVHDNTVTELCPAIHAEAAAILKKLGAGYAPSKETLYHIKVKGGKVAPSGAPSCTSCSKSILASGISEVVLFHGKGVAIGGAPPLEKACYVVYNAEEFNELSFRYFEVPNP